MTRRIKRFKKNIKIVKKATGLSTFKIILKFIKIKLLGISIKDYVKYKLYKFNKKEFDKIKRIKKESKWTLSKIMDELKDAKKKGLSLYSYDHYKCWMLSDKEQKELSDTLKKWREKQVLNKKWYVNALIEKTGCTKKEALEKLEIAKKKNYNYYTFFVRGYYSLSISELEKLPNYQKRNFRTTDTNEEIKKRRTFEREEMKQEMNWNDAQFDLNYLKAEVNCGCTPHEFYILGLYKISPKKQKEFITSEIWRKMYLRYCDYADTWKYFKQKVLFNEKFAKFIKRDWLNVEGMNFSSFKAFAKDKDMFIYKPLDTACGIGINKYKIRHNTLSLYFRYLSIKRFKEGIIEEIIKQHKTMESLNPSSINTVRVQTITLNGKTDILNATVRMGASSKSKTDNFSSGGIMANLDLKTGKIITKASSKMGGTFDEHPESGVKFSTFKVPNWDKVLETVKEASKVVETMPYIGWDVVINEDDSIQLIEGNHDADCVFHQYCPAIAEHKGIRKTIDKYIWFDDKEKTV